jgi:hypothetical protein
VTSVDRIELWNTASKSRLCDLAPQRKPTAIAFATNGARLAIGDDDGGLRIADVSNCAERRSRDGKGAAIAFISYRQDGTLVTGDAAGELRVEDDDGAPIAQAQFLPNRSWVEDESTGHVLGFGTTGTPALWSGGRQGLISPEEAGSGPTFYGSLQPRGDLVITRSDALRVWSGRTGHVILSMPVAPSTGENAGFSADGSTLLANLPGQGGLKILRLPSGQALIDLARRNLDSD